MEARRLYPNIEMDANSNFNADDFFCDSSIVADKETQTSLIRESSNREMASKRWTSKDHEENLDLGDDSNKSNSIFFDGSEASLFSSMVVSDDIVNEREQNTSSGQQSLTRRYFYYEDPLIEETGAWIPVSLPPLSESEHEEWLNGGYLPEKDPGWQHDGQELTMWAVVKEVLEASCSKALRCVTRTNTDAQVSRMMSSGPLPRAMLEQAWKEMAQTLTDSTYNGAKDILNMEPPRWLADSVASACMMCNVRFHPILCPRHHCRFCGSIFCGKCTKGRSLLPEKFRVSDLQRVCDVCWVRLESVQSILMKKVSNAMQPATHDVTDLSTLRSWMNFPWAQSMQYEIYKATNTLRSFIKVGTSRPEKFIPAAVLRHAKGLAILTIAKVGVMVTYKVGTGLVVARKEDGSWSAPAAIASFGVGWGFQAGGELTDFIIILRTNQAVKMFSGNIHFSLGAGLSIAAGPVGRVAEADIRAGTGGSTACYTYSCSKGAFFGCSLEGNVVNTRKSTNCKFYGNPCIKASDILYGPVLKPTAADPLYKALSDLFDEACKP